MNLSTVIIATPSHNMTAERSAGLRSPGVATLLARFTSLPLPGTPSWCALPDSDPAKMASLLAVARYWAFDAACRQEAKAEASEAIAGAAPWGRIGQELQQRRKVIADGAYIERRSSK